MTSARNASLAIQRESLRTQLVAQRAVIAQQLDLDAESGYPRSATMRLLKRATVPAVTMIGSTAALFGGLRLYKTIAAVLGVMGTLRATASRR